MLPKPISHLAFLPKILRPPKIAVWFVVMTLLLSKYSFAQTYNANPDLGNIKGSIKEKLKKPFTINGGVALNTILMSNTGNNQSTPSTFTWIATGNLNMTIFGYALPFSFNYSNRQAQFSNPSFKFNRFTLNPKYKNWSAQIGEIATSFSPYTLNGFRYTGASVKYTGKKWQVQALYGRFLTAVAEDSTHTPAYHRPGFGTQIFYNNEGKKFGLTAFYAKDKINSIPPPVLKNNLAIKPAEGTTFSLQGAYPIMKTLTIEMTYNTSILTKDITFIDTKPVAEPTISKLISKVNATTSVYHAYQASLAFAIKKTNLALQYERVDPDYQTLGAYYFTNDFENLSVQIAQNFLKGKLSLSGNIGIQKDDLNDTKQSKMKRILLAFNAGIIPTKNLNASIAYSNMQCFTILKTGFEQINQTTPYPVLDSLNFTQLSQNTMVQLNYTIVQNKKQSHTLNFVTNIMQTANKKGDFIGQGQVGKFMNTALNYAFTLPESQLSLSLGLNYNRTYVALQTTTTMGPVLNIAKPVLKKILKLQIGIAYNTNKTPTAQMNILNLRLGGTATIAKKHNLSFNLMNQQKSGSGGQAQRYFMGNMGYAFNF